MTNKMMNKMMNLQGRTALITGAAGYLGSAIAAALGELGANLLLVDSDLERLLIIKNELLVKWSTVEVEVFKCDLEVLSDRLKLFNEISLITNDISILINNAAFIGDTDLGGWITRFEEQSIETWRRAIEVNLTAPFHLSQLFLPLLEKGRGANIINLASIYGVYGPSWDLYEDTNMGNPAAYSASKGGLIQLTRWLATTLSPRIRVNSISPGGIYRGQNNTFVKKYIQKTPLNRMATESDVAGVVLFLCSDLASYITGQNILVDGGWGVV